MKLISRILDKIIIIIFSPILIVGAVVSVFTTESVGRSFKFLIDEGYVLKKVGSYRYYSKGVIVFQILYNQLYAISINNSEFKQIYEVNVGSEIARDRLKSILLEYQGANPVDKQRGDTVNTLQPFCGFIKYNLNEIEGLAQKVENNISE